MRSVSEQVSQTRDAVPHLYHTREEAGTDISQRLVLIVWSFLEVKLKQTILSQLTQSGSRSEKYLQLITRVIAFGVIRRLCI